MKQDFVEVDIPRTKKPVAKRSRLAAIVSLHQVKINVYQEAENYGLELDNDSLFLFCGNRNDRFKGL